MCLQSLKSKLLLGVFTLVICSGVFISLMVTHRYSRNLFQALAGQSQYLGHAVALQAADLVLINDPVGLEKMLEHQLQSNPSLTYLFIVKDGQVLAHTFPQGIPIDLIRAKDWTPKISLTRRKLSRKAVSTPWNRKGRVITRRDSPPRRSGRTC